MKLLYLFAIGILFTSCNNTPDLKNVKPAKLEIFEVYSYAEMANVWQEAYRLSKELDTIATSGAVSLSNIENRNLQHLLLPNGPNDFYVEKNNKKAVDSILAIEQIRKLFPEDLSFMYQYKTINQGKNEFYVLYCIREVYPKRDRVTGADIANVEKQDDSYLNQPLVMIEMTPEGSKKWHRLTERNIGRALAVTINGAVISCPIVQNEISDGKVQISGNFTEQEAEDLAMALKAGQKWKH